MFGKNAIAKAVYWDKKAPSEEAQGKVLAVNSIFGTIQGEGPYAGRPAIFIRLAGCNLRCHFCDTEFEKSELLPIEEIERRVNALSFPDEPGGCNTELVVLTGGEPMRQQISPLLMRLAVAGFHTQIETAGSLWPEPVAMSQEQRRIRPPERTSVDILLEPEVDDVTEWDYLLSLIQGGHVDIVCSPKTPTVDKMIVATCQHYKYIIRKDEIAAMDGLPVVSTQKQGERAMLYRPSSMMDVDDPTIWIQPCAEYKSPDVVDLAATRENMAECVRIAKLYGYRISLQQHKILDVE